MFAETLKWSLAPGREDLSGLPHHHKTARSGLGKDRLNYPPSPMAAPAFVLVGRVSRHPVRTYRFVAAVALFVSYLNPSMLLAGLFPAVGMNLPIFWTMIVMHCFSALITASLLTTLAVEQ